MDHGHGSVHSSLHRLAPAPLNGVKRLYKVKLSRGVYRVNIDSQLLTITLTPRHSSHYTHTASCLFSTSDVRVISSDTDT